MSDASLQDERLLQFTKDLEALEAKNEAQIKRTMAQSVYQTLNRLKRAYGIYRESDGESMRYTIQSETARYRQLMEASASLLDAQTMKRMRQIYQDDLEEAYELGEESTNELIETVEDPDNVHEELTQMPTAAQVIAGQRLAAFWEKERVELREKVTGATLRALQQGKGWKGAQRDIVQALRTSGQSILRANDELSVTARGGIVMNLQQRANLVARTELASAYVQGQIKQYKQNGFDYGRWSATGERSCAFCVAREGVIYPLEEIEAAIPAHPRCRCTIGPVTNEAFKAQQDAANAEIGAAEYLDDGGWTAIRQKRFDEWMKFTGNTKLDAAKYLAKPTNTEKFFKGADAKAAKPAWIPSGDPQPNLKKAAAATKAVEKMPSTNKAEERNLKSEERELKRAAKAKRETQKTLKGQNDVLTKAERAYLDIKSQKSKFRSDKAKREEMQRRGFLKSDDPHGELIKIAKNVRDKTANQTPDRVRDPLVAKTAETKARSVPQAKKTTTNVNVKYDDHEKLGYERKQQLTAAKKAVDDYVKDGYDPIRQAQAARMIKAGRGEELTGYERRAGRELIKEEGAAGVTKWGKRADTIEQFISNAPKYKGEVFRGMNFAYKDQAEAYIQSLTSGKASVNINSWSTEASHSKKFAQGATNPNPGEAGVVFRVDNRSGAPVSSLNPSGEGEVLVPSGVRYEVSGIKQLPTENGVEMTEVVLREVLPD